MPGAVNPQNTSRGIAYGLRMKVPEVSSCGIPQQNALPAFNQEYLTCTADAASICRDCGLSETCNEK